MPTDAIDFEDPHNSNNTLIFDPREDGKVFVSICEERPDGAYTKVDELLFTLSRAQAIGLRDWLLKNT